ncbi:hypothetical protein FQN60_008550 [Etheostoma spectabile]|uniref:Serpin domain-containing protein n=1 Tax=Etheostoma spectabile TaxID=54343 RepID=A0A5J5CBC7_9PERO|nr:hypothetical protein FQN60_008550 [Etheostoma spectabile]
MAKEKDTENILISPVVVASSLGMVALGGKASTASQVKTVLSAEKLRDEHLHAGLSELLSEVSDAKTRNTTWKINNRLYGPSSVSFADDFVKKQQEALQLRPFKNKLQRQEECSQLHQRVGSQVHRWQAAEITKDVQNPDGAMIVNAMFLSLTGMRNSVLKWWTHVLSW